MLGRWKKNLEWVQVFNLFFRGEGGGAGEGGSKMEEDVNLSEWEEVGEKKLWALA